MSVRRFISSDIAELALMVTGGVLVVGGVAYAKSAAAKTRKSIKPLPKRGTGGITVTADQCSDWDFDDHEAYHAEMRPVYTKYVDMGVTDPWLITDAVLKRVTPMCRTLDQGARNENEAFLQYVLFIDVITHMLNDGLLNEDGFAVAELEIYDYAIEHGVPASAIEEWRNSE